MTQLYSAFLLKGERKTNLLRKALSCLAVFLVLPVLLVIGGAGKPVAKVEPIVLKSEQLPFQTKEFYIADVSDDRVNPKTIGQIVPLGPTSVTAEAVDLQGGSLPAIKKYIKESFSANSKARPIIIRLKEYKVTEKPAPGGRWVEGQIQIAVSYELKREGKQIHLLDFKSSAKYARKADNMAVVEPTLRTMLSESLRYITTWVEREAPQSEKLAWKIKVHYEDYQQNTDDDTVFYNPKRPLNWDDFRGGSHISGSYGATVFPGVSNDAHVTVKDGVLHVHISIKAFMVRSLSKALPSVKNDHTLNHEQRHFDIAKLVAEHYKQRVTPEKLTIEDYQSIIHYQYLEALWEMGRLQQQYDDETSHGSNASAQYRWNQKIDDELRSLKVIS